MQRRLVTSYAKGGGPLSTERGSEDIAEKKEYLYTLTLYKSTGLRRGRRGIEYRSEERKRDKDIKQNEEVYRSQSYVARK